MKKSVSAEEAKKNHKFIHLLVFKCEAQWAYAMNQRQIITKVTSAPAGSKETKNPNRARHLARKRLQKASQSS